ncbi:MAG: hypothetical protein LAO08_00880 [Acidobacteriia bacterium]|nr:hypothetical protein [Terriglobia bacterium]
MILAIAVLMIHPQLAPPRSFSAEKAALVQLASAESSSNPEGTENSLPTASATLAVPDQPAADPSTASLPDAPVPAPAVNSPAPLAYLKKGRPGTVSISELREEDRQNQILWRGLVIMSHGAATFDAWSTRRAITRTGAQELNPMLRPFAGNASLYAAIQVAPLLMDYAGKKMMYSRHGFLRRTWWVPQSASFVSSIFCGTHNVAFH